MSMNPKNLGGGNSDEDMKDPPSPKNADLEDDEEIAAGSPSSKSKKLGKRKADDTENGKGIQELLESKKQGKKPKVDHDQDEQDIPALSPSSESNKLLGNTEIDDRKQEHDSESEEEGIKQFAFFKEPELLEVQKDNENEDKDIMSVSSPEKDPIDEHDDQNVEEENNESSGGEDTDKDDESEKEKSSSSGEDSNEERANSAEAPQEQPRPDEERAISEEAPQEQPGSDKDSEEESGSDGEEVTSERKSCPICNVVLPHL